MRRFDFQDSPYGQKGGLSLYVTSGVISGLEVSLNGTAGDGVDGTDSTLASITISAGNLKFDGNLVKLTADLDATIQTEVDLATDDAIVDVYVNPTRLTKSGAVLPDPAGYSDGDYYLLTSQVVVGQNVPYELVQAIYIVKAGAWKIADPMRDFEGLKSMDYGWQNQMLNNIVPELTVANVAGQNELPIFHSVNRSPHIFKPGSALLRQSAGIKLATIEYTGGAGTITETLAPYNQLLI